MNLTWKPLAEEHFALLCELEHKAFPEPNQGTFEASLQKRTEPYKQWHAETINLSQVCIDSDKHLVGLLSVIPVNDKGWAFIHEMNTDDLDEYALINDYLYRPGKDNAIGFHVYMIQKLDTTIHNFTELAYRAMFRKFHSDAALWNNPKVLGISGFSVSPEAIHIAFNVLNRQEIHTVDGYMVINPNGQLEGISIHNKQEFTDLLAKGYKIRNRCRLTSVSYEQPSIAWKWLEEEKELI